MGQVLSRSRSDEDTYAVKYEAVRFSRREFLLSTAGATLLTGAAAAAAPVESSSALKPDERQFLEDYAKRCVRYFWEQANEHTGIVMDRAKNDGARSGDNVGSSAATGFGLSA